MPYAVLFTPAADRDLAKLNPPDRIRIIRKIESLRDQPRPPGCKKLIASSDQYRLRVGHYRVLYQILDDKLIVIIIRAGHRSDIYRKK